MLELIKEFENATNKKIPYVFEEEERVMLNLLMLMLAQQKIFLVGVLKEQFMKLA